MERVGTTRELLDRLTDMEWNPESIRKVQKRSLTVDVLILRGKLNVEWCTVTGPSLRRAIIYIQNKKGNSRVRLYVTDRASSRLGK